MRSLRFLPLVFLIGIDGFVMFAPYVLAVLGIAYTVRSVRAPQPALQTIPVAAPLSSPVVA